MVASLAAGRSPRRLLVTLAAVALAGAGAAFHAVAADAASAAPRNSTMTAHANGGSYTVVQLKNLVADRIGAWQQVSLDVPMESRALPQAPTLVYGFRDGERKATLTLTDGGAANSAPGPAHWTGPPSRRDTDAGREHVYREGRYTVHEVERRTPPAREVVLRLANGLVVTVAGDADMAALKALATGLSLEQAATMVRPAGGVRR